MHTTRCAFLTGVVTIFLSFFGGIETEIKICTLLNGQVDAWTQLFQSIDTNFVHCKNESLQIDFNGTDVYFKTYNK